MRLFGNQRDPIPARRGTTYTLRREPDGRFVALGRTGQQIRPKGLYQFATMPDGTVRVSCFGEHVHLTGGGPVRYAGQARFKRGRRGRGTLVWWSNGSGHYLPDAALAAQAGLPVELFVPEIVT